MTIDDKPTDKSRLAFGGKRSQVRITAQYLRHRGKTSVTLTRTELEHLAELIRAGRVLTKDYRDVSKNLRQAMNKLGVNTKGL